MFNSILGFLAKVNAALSSFFSWLLAFIYHYPFIIAAALLLTIYLINHLTLIRFQSSNYEFYNFVFFAIGTYLFYQLIVNQDIVPSINRFFTDFSKVCTPTYGDTCALSSLGVSKFGVFLVACFSLLIAINSRLMWILSIPLMELYFIAVDQNSIFYNLLSQIPQDHREFFRGIVPFFLTAPVLLIIWVFRDNDRFQDIANKERELELKSSELQLRSKEFSLKEKEFNLNLERYK